VTGEKKLTERKKTQVVPVAGGEEGGGKIEQKGGGKATEGVGGGVRLDATMWTKKSRSVAIAASKGGTKTKTLNGSKNSGGGGCAEGKFCQRGVGRGRRRVAGQSITRWPGQRGRHTSVRNSRHPQREEGGLR